MRRIHAAVLGCLLACGAHAAVQPGDTPPDALGTQQDGTAVRVSALRGNVVVISFWATWCGYCMKELPVLANLQALATERKLPLQVVSINDQESREVFVRTTRVLRPRYPGLLLSWDRNGSIGARFGTAKGIPVMVMLHRDGSVAHVHVGYGEDMLDQLVAEINALLREPAPTAVAATQTHS